MPKFWRGKKNYVLYRKQKKEDKYWQEADRIVQMILETEKEECDVQKQKMQMVKIKKS